MSLSWLDTKIDSCIILLNTGVLNVRVMVRVIFDHIVNFFTFAYHHKQYEIINYYQLYGCHIPGNHTVESSVM